MQGGAGRVGLRGLGWALGRVWEGAWARSVEDKVGLGQGLSCNPPDNTSSSRVPSRPLLDTWPHCFSVGDSLGFSRNGLNSNTHFLDGVAKAKCDIVSVRHSVNRP